MKKNNTQWRLEEMEVSSEDDSVTDVEEDSVDK